MGLNWDLAPCGMLRANDGGAILATNPALARLCGRAAGDPMPAHLDELLRPASRLYYQLSFFPALRMTGLVEEVYLEFKDKAGASVAALVNARRDEATGVSEWAVMRIEQRGRWEEAVLEARRAAERESEAHARKSAELAEAKAELERVLAELKETNWLLHKVADVLPTCMYCGRVKPGGGTDWESAIEFLKKNSRFLSHGCCPQCVSYMRGSMSLPPMPGSSG